MNTFLALLLAAAHPAAAADAPAAKDASVVAAPAPAKTPDELDKAAEERVKSLEDCVDTLDWFREDLKDKKSSLDKEFKGKVPSSFATLLNMKADRISKQQVACSRLASGADQPLEASWTSARAMDGSSKAYAERRKRLDALRERLNKALKRFKTN